MVFTFGIGLILRAGAGPKDQQSNLSGGIDRTVSVYDVNGQLIKEYSGKFDIETDQRELHSV